jgi:hypothetical protein
MVMWVTQKTHSIVEKFSAFRDSLLYSLHGKYVGGASAPTYRIVCDDGNVCKKQSKLSLKANCQQLKLCVIHGDGWAGKVRQRNNMVRDFSKSFFACPLELFRLSTAD